MAGNTAEKSTTALPQWETDKPYGSKLALLDTPKESVLLLIIEPHKHTGIGIDQSKLDSDGLRPHPGERVENVKFLKYADGKPDDGLYPLVYKYKKIDERGIGKVQECRYGLGNTYLSGQDKCQLWGDTFESVRDPVLAYKDNGYWHILINDLDRPIMLLITVKKENAPLHLERTESEAPKP